MSSLSSDDFRYLDYRSPSGAHEHNMKLVALEPGALGTLTRAAEPLTLLHQAARMPDCDFGRSPEENIFDPFKGFSKINRVSRLTCFTAYVKALHGNTAAAIEDLTAARAIARFESSGGDLMSALVANESYGRYLSSLIRCLSEAKTEEDLGRYIALIRSGGFSPDLQAVVKAMAYQEWVLAKNATWPSNLRDIEAVKAWLKMHRDDVPSSPGMRADLARFLGSWSGVFERLNRAKGNPAKTRAVLISFESSPQRLNALPPVLKKSRTEPLLPTFFTLLDRDRANEQCTLVLAHALLYRIKKGRFPDRLSDLNLKTSDPFVKGPLHYRRTPTGVVVYSVGPDRVDDHGLSRRERHAKGKDGTYDIAAAYPPFLGKAASQS